MDDIHPLTTFRARHDPPLSQDDVAKMLGVARVTVTRWEAGTRKPDETLLPKIARLTGISPHRLRPDLAEFLRAQVT